MSSNLTASARTPDSQHPIKFKNALKPVLSGPLTGFRLFQVVPEARRGLPFELARDFDFTTARIEIDDRYEYGEQRYFALGFIGERLYALAFTVRDGVVRVISLRKANKREVAIYERNEET